MADIRLYQKTDEAGWRRCRVLSFLDTAYFDDVLPHKEHFARPSIELVAEEEGQIVGLLDAECEEQSSSLCTPEADYGNQPLGVMIWSLAVHPDYQRKGLASALLLEARRLASERQATYFEAWTRDDEAARQWYLARGFRPITSYLQVFAQGMEVEGTVTFAVPSMRLASAWLHYTGEERERVRGYYQRVHECTMYHLRL